MEKSNSSEEIGRFGTSVDALADLTYCSVQAFETRCVSTDEVRGLSFALREPNNSPSFFLVTISKQRIRSSARYLSRFGISRNPQSKRPSQSEERTCSFEKCLRRLPENASSPQGSKRQGAPARASRSGVPCTGRRRTLPVGPRCNRRRTRVACQGCLTSCIRIPGLRREG
jgi:hypothetical protein